MISRLVNRLADWLCSRLGILVRIDGDLMTPESPDDPWWYKEA